MRVAQAIRKGVACLVEPVRTAPFAADALYIVVEHVCIAAAGLLALALNSGVGAVRCEILNGSRLAVRVRWRVPCRLRTGQAQNRADRDTHRKSTVSALSNNTMRETVTEADSGHNRKQLYLARPLLRKGREQVAGQGTRSSGALVRRVLL